MKKKILEGKKCTCGSPLIETEGHIICLTYAMQLSSTLDEIKGALKILKIKND